MQKVRKTPCQDRDLFHFAISGERRLCEGKAGNNNFSIYYAFSLYFVINHRSNSIQKRNPNYIPCPFNHHLECLHKIMAGKFTNDWLLI